MSGISEQCYSLEERMDRLEKQLSVEAIGIHKRVVKLEERALALPSDEEIEAALKKLLTPKERA